MPFVSRTDIGLNTADAHPVVVIQRLGASMHDTLILSKAHNVPRWDEAALDAQRLRQG